MQPPPRTAPPGAAGPPPTGGVPNAFRRTRLPYGKPGNTPMPVAAALIPPVTDPFAYGRQAPQTTPVGNHPPPPRSSPLPMQNPLPSGFLQTPPVQSQSAPPQMVDGPHPARPLPSTAGLPISLFTPHSSVAPSLLPGHFSNADSFTSPAPPGAERGQFNSREHSPYHVQGAPENSFEGTPFAAAPLQNRATHGQEMRREPASYNPMVPSTIPFPPQNMQPSATQWVPDHGSRPPSVQNYFQPSSEHPSQSFSAPPPASSPATIPPQPPPQSQVRSDHQGHIGQQNVMLGPGSATSDRQQFPDTTEGSEVPVSQHYNPQIPAQSYFNQSFSAHDPWYCQPAQEQFYHQMAGAASNNLPNFTNPEPAAVPWQAGLPPATNPALYESDPGTISMFFKGNDVENEETLASEQTTINGVAGGDSLAAGQGTLFNPSFPNQQPQSLQPQMGVEVAQSTLEVHQQSFDRSVTVHSNAHLGSGAIGSYESGIASDTQKNVGAHFDNVENLECVTNQEVLPSEPHNVPPLPQNANEGIGPGESNPAAQVGDNFEGGPNLETPDSIPHPVRSESVSSSYSNVSHSSASSTRRPQGVVGTFIQQEIAKSTEEVSAGYFEQIDTSPAVELQSVEQNMPNVMYQSQLSQPPTPSPPKPTGIFQASANSSFEPVRSHGVGVKPIEVDQARMVMEKNNGAQGTALQGLVVSDASPGNLEQPPDNLENIFMPSGHHHAMGPPHVGSPTNVMQPIVKPMVETVLPERRPSSRTHGARLKCESPATTLWAQNEMQILGANILLAPAAPPVHSIIKNPSAEVIQPPEDGPLNHSFQQQSPYQAPPAEKPDTSSENLENPPKVGESDPLSTQASLGYASLLVTSPAAESFQNQPVLIAPPAQNCVIPSNNAPLSLLNQVNPSETLPNQGTDEKALPVQQVPVTSGTNALQPGPPTSMLLPNHPPHLIASSMTSSGNISSQPGNMIIPSPLHHNPLNLAPESRQNVKRPPESTAPQSVNATISRADAQVGHNNLAHTPTSSQAQPGIPLNASNYELLNFSLHNPQTNQNQAPNSSTHPPLVGSQQPVAIKQGTPDSNAAGVYLQVTKGAQQTGKGQHEPPMKQLAGVVSPPVNANAQQQAAEQSQKPEVRPGPQGNGASPQGPLPNNQYPQPPPTGPGLPGVEAPNRSVGYPAGPGGPQPPQYPPHLLSGNSQQPPDPQRPPSTHPPAPGYGPPSQPPAPGYGPPSQPPVPGYGPPSQPPVPGYGLPPPNPAPGYGGYYGGAYPEYPDGRQPYPPPYPPSDPRAAQPYCQDDPYRKYDARYGRYEGYNPGYREGERYQYPEQPERPSSRTSQYSDRPSSRQGYPEDYQRTGRSAYDEYYADYYKKQYDYGDRSRWDRYDPASYDSRYREYYDPSYWYNYDPEAYRRREAYYSQQYPMRREGYDDRWRYDPRYDSSFDDEYGRPRDPYVDDYDRRSVHSEQSAHSVHSSRSQHSRRSSFSSHSQQSQVYRSQQDLVGASYEPSGQAPALPADYSYQQQYPDNVDGSQSFAGYQYPSGYPAESGWSSVEQAPPRPVTPEKYSVPHMCARFGPGGQLIKVLPNLPSEGQPALVEIHSMETMMQDTQEQEELRSFPGPLVKEETHKVDVIKFAQNKALECLRNDSLVDKDSAYLIWEFIVLLCRQNGTVVGTDIADLLLREHKSVWLPGKSPNETNLIDFNNEPLEKAEEDPSLGQLSLLSDTIMTVPENTGKETERFRELLLFGRKKDALESAMKNALWGHALLLASKMDNRTHARVMTRFANSLPINDPLQTVYQLMSGRMPAAATCCGDEKWGDWRPHLAMVLSNLTHTLDLDTRTITTIGDTLASKGLTDAAHFCYIMAQVGLGVYTKKSTKMVLIGANHSLPFFKFASNEAIQRTEAYEYAQSLGSQSWSLPNFQVFKFIYACRLAEVGLSAQAFHYCEVISRTLLSHPSYFSPMFISQLIQISAKLRFFDPQLKEKPEQELFKEPDWLEHLRQLDGQIKEGAISYNSDRATPQQYECSTPSSEFDQPSPPSGPGMHQDPSGAAPENPLMTSLMPNPGPVVPGVQLMPPAPLLDGTMPSGPPAPPPPADGGVQFYPVPPAPLGPVPGSAPPAQGPMPGYPPPGLGYGVPYQQEQPETMYPVQPMPLQMPPQMPPPESLPTVPEQQHSYQPERRLSSQPSSPARSTFTPHPQMDFYDQMVHMVPGKRSRSTSQSSVYTSHGRRSRTTSESSCHSIGRDRSNSAAKQPSSPPPASIPEQPASRPEEPKKPSKKDSPKKGGRGGWFSWLYPKGNNEAHLPDDKNKTIVWDEAKQRWVNLDEPEEESKPLPPPPSGFPKMGPQMGPQMGPGGPGGPPTEAPPVNIFSRKAGTRSRYVDVLNPGGAGSKPSTAAPAPADLFAPLAPMPIPANLFVPGSAPESQQPLEGSVPETEPSTEPSTTDAQSQPQFYNPGLYPPGSDGTLHPDGTPSGEVPNQPPPQGGPPTGGVTFYNPSQFAQPSAPSGGARAGRFGQRKYPALK
ncbi:protein transport protein Sec16A isoform X2 [Amia ocellicauda]|uniref:protein transport protein Sec16A isoform X2 n=1 Tax=Amia ocellicauda TaxID=2972642 RepID=UPI0034643171